MRTFAESPSGGSEDGSHNDADHVSKAVSELLKLESDDKTWGERVSERITSLTGTLLFVVLHMAFFAVWIVANFSWWGYEPFDPFPYNLLTMIVSLEAIFLSVFVLMSENRQAKELARRAKVDLQVDMIAEQEVTKLMELVMEIHDHLGIKHQHDPELHAMQKPTSIEELAKAAQGDSESKGDRKRLRDL